MILLKKYIFSIGCHFTRPPLSFLVFLYQVPLWYNIVFLVFLASVFRSWCLLHTVLTFVTPLFFLSVGAYRTLLLLSIKMYGVLYIPQNFAGFSLMNSLPQQGVFIFLLQFLVSVVYTNSRIRFNTENYTEEGFKNTYTYRRIKSGLIMLRWIIGIGSFLCDTDIAFCSVN